MNDKLYYTDKTAAVAGPVSREQLQQLIDTGQVPPDSQVCIEGSEDWKPLARFVRETPKPKAATPTAKPGEQAETSATLKPETTPNKLIEAARTFPAKLLKEASATPAIASAAIISTVIGLALLAFIAWKLIAITSPQFEYKISAPKDYLFDSQMNVLGAEGWEIVSARRATSSNEYDHSASYEVILKRRIR